MKKKILHWLIVVMLLVYMVFAVAFISPKVDTDCLCTEITIEVVKSNGISYLKPEQIQQLLERSSIYPINKKMSEIHLEAIERELKKAQLIRSVECYKTVNGNLKIRVFQWYPILRVISNTGNYYVDFDGEILPLPNGFSAYVPLATGTISEEYAKTKLLEFVHFLRKNKTWDDQIEEIYVLPNGDVELIPNKGSHRILLGKIENYRENLNKLELFYKKALDEIGWDRYSLINLKYENQVICTKK